MTCSCLRTFASGASVGESAKSAPPSPAGHNAAGMAPFGTYTKAMRVGRVLSAALAKAARLSEA